MEYLSLLHQLYAIHAPSYREWTMITFVRNYINRNVPEAKVRFDKLGNLYITKGKAGVGFPTLACHLDQVQTLHSDDFCVKEEKGTLYGWSEKNQQREGLGADDKNGIWVCLRCLKECPLLKIFMAVGEEKGCIGSNHADMSFFADSLYVLEPDCKGGEEIHTNLKGIPCASPDFEQALLAAQENIKSQTSNLKPYVITPGKGSDIFVLTLNGIGVSCANIPAGYHLPHKDEEYTIISELKHSYDFIKQTVLRLNQRFSHEYKTETQKFIESWACQQ